MTNAMVQKLQVMPREMRLMTERILNLTPLPIGFTRILWDIVMYSQALGLGGFQMLEDKLNLLMVANLKKIHLLSAKNGRYFLDGGGQHSWLIIPTTLDLLREGLGEATFSDKKRSLVTVENVEDISELSIAQSLAPRFSINIKFEGSNLLAVSGKKGPDQTMDKLLNQGCMIDQELWWRIFELAQESLTEESAISLTHAGPVMIGQDGESIGREDNDDDTDLNLLKDPKMLTKE